MVVLVINGYPRSGKDTFCDILGYKYSIYRHSTVATMKGIMQQLGWDGEKTGDMRQALSDLKDWYTRYFDGSFKEIQDSIESYGDFDFVTVMSREPEEIGRIARWCSSNDYPCFTIFVDRSQAITDLKHHSDADVGNYTYDYYVDNNSTVNAFYNTVFTTIDDIIKKVER